MRECIADRSYKIQVLARLGSENVQGVSDFDLVGESSGGAVISRELFAWFRFDGVHQSVFEIRRYQDGRASIVVLCAGLSLEFLKMLSSHVSARQG